MKPLAKSELIDDMVAVSKYLNGCHVKEEANILSGSKLLAHGGT